MQHLRAAVGKLAQFAVGRALDGARMIDNTGIGHENAGDIRPVFIDIRIQRRRGQRARDIRAAARERAELTVRHQAIEARNDDALVPGQRAQRGIGFLLIDGAVIVEEQPLRGVHERKAR